MARTRRRLPDFDLGAGAAAGDQGPGFVLRLGRKREIPGFAQQAGELEVDAAVLIGGEGEGVLADGVFGVAVPNIGAGKEVVDLPLDGGPGGAFLERGTGFGVAVAGGEDLGHQEVELRVIGVVGEGGVGEGGGLVEAAGGEIGGGGAEEGAGVVGVEGEGLFVAVEGVIGLVLVAEQVADQDKGGGGPGGEVAVTGEGGDGKALVRFDGPVEGFGVVG